MANARELIERVLAGERADAVIGTITEGQSKKDFIAIADHIKHHNRIAAPENHFNDVHIHSLADHLATTNPRFNRSRWLGYVKGENGSNGGAVKK